MDVKTISKRLMYFWIEMNEMINYCLSNIYVTLLAIIYSIIL